MRRKSLFMTPFILLVTSCSSSSSTEAIMKSKEYLIVSDYWDTFPASWESDVCGEISGSDDKAGIEKSVKIMKLMLKVNKGIETDITKDDAYSSAIRILLSGNC